MVKRKGLAYYFEGFKTIRDYNVASRDIKRYLESNGFVVSRQRVANPKYGFRKIKGVRYQIQYINIATQISTGRTIVYDVATSSTAETISERVLDKLERFVSNKRVMFIVQDGLKETVGSLVPNTSLEIELVAIPSKSNQEQVEDAIKRKEELRNTKFSSIQNFTNELQCDLYDYAFDYLKTVYERSETVPKYAWLVNTMKDAHPTLCKAITSKELSTTLKTAHKEWCEAVYN